MSSVVTVEELRGCLRDAELSACVYIDSRHRLFTGPTPRDRKRLLLQADSAMGDLLCGVALHALSTVDVSTYELAKSYIEGLRDE